MLRALVPVVVLLVVGCQHPLQHGLPEDQANEIVSVLEAAGIGVAKQLDEGSDPAAFTIAVARSDGARALSILQSRGLPRGSRTGLQQVYGKPSLIPTATEEGARYMSALTGELERTLETVDGVAASRVHLVMEQRDPYGGSDTPRSPARAAVLLKVRTGVAPLKEAEVQRLVAGSVQGLQPEAVTVVVTAAPESPSEAAALVPVGPLRVSPGSRRALFAGLGLAVVLLAAISVALLRTVRKLAALERQIRTQDLSRT